MKTIIKNAQIITPSKVVKGNLVIENDHFVEINNEEENSLPSAKVYDASNCYLTPGFIDVHTHGGYGYDFMGANSLSTHKFLKQQLSEGTTGLLATTMTETTPKITQALRSYAAFQKKYSSDHSVCQMYGIHTEGPFLSSQKCGAQNPELIIPPNLDIFREWMSLTNNSIRICTLAIENDEEFTFAKFLKKAGVIVSIGHTNASYELACKCFKAGVTHATHMYNAMTSLNHRSPGVVGALLEKQTAKCELICDGIHVAPAVVNLTYKILGAKQIMLVTDAMEAKGLSPGEYKIGGQKVTVKNNRAVLAGSNTLAGSVAKFINCYQNFQKFTGANLVEMSWISATNQAKELRINHQVGSIEPGKIANFLILDQQLGLQKTFLFGKVRYAK